MCRDVGAIFVWSFCLLTLCTLWEDAVHAQKITADKSMTDRTVVLRINDILRIELPGTPTTGYWWHFDSIDRGFLEPVADEVKLPADGRDGGPALGVWEFKALKEGVTILKAAYYRSWEDRSSAIDHFQLSIVIKTDQTK